MKATSADSNRLIHTILAHSSIAASFSTAASSTPPYLSIFQSFVAIGHLEFKLLSFLLTFTMNFSLSKPDFTKYFTFETKYSIAIILLLSGDAKDKWINAHNDIMPNNENPTEARFRAVWTAFIINYGASDKTAKGLRDFL
jgi:hypothetical protein